MGCLPEEYQKQFENISCFKKEQPLTKEENEALTLLRLMDGHINEEYGPIFAPESCIKFEDFIKKIRKNGEYNLELATRIYKENIRLRGLMKTKINSLISKASLTSYTEAVEIGKGNTCNNPCYLYNRQIMEKCPKCGDTVVEEPENGFTWVKKWEDGVQKEVKNYNQTKICNKFTFNNNIEQWDVNIVELFKHYEKEDPEKKHHVVVNYLDEKKI